MTELKPAEEIFSEKFPFLNPKLLHSRLLWSVRLRWLAILGFGFAGHLIRNAYNPALPFQTIWFVLILLGIINTLYYLAIRLVKKITLKLEFFYLHLHMIVDIIFLSLLVHYSGGIDNPIYFFYIFHVVLSSILFQTRTAYVYATIISLTFAALTLLESQQLIPHFCILEKSAGNKEMVTIITLLVFIVSTFMTTFICTSFIQVYRQSKRIINLQNKQLMKLIKQKSQFLRYASHELKSPVIAVKSSLDVVIKTFSSEIPHKAKDLLMRAAKRSEQMLDIIKELLELSHAKTPIEEKAKDKLNPCKIIADIIEALKPTAQSKELLIETKLTSPPVFIVGHERDLKSIFQNLISNAIRYTPQGGRISIKTAVQNKRFIFEISDTGIGIAEEDLNTVFAEFYRSENARQMASLGTGLGLSLVKQIVDRYQGSVSVQSKLNEGSTFVVHLPCEKNREK